MASKEERGTELQSFRRRRPPRLFGSGARLPAVGRHLGFRGTGAESGEILVVTGSRDPEQRAYGPDDDLPHPRRWAEDR